MANRHLIGKQVFELELSSSENSYVLQQRISELVWKDLMPKMEALFDEIVGAEEVFRFDKIELDLGTLNFQGDDLTNLAHKIMELLKAEFLKAGVLLKADRIAEGPELKRNAQQPLRQHYFDIWLYWLEKGTLPSYSLTPEAHWLELVLETLGLEDEAITRLAETVEKHPVALDRLVLQHGTKDLISLVELYTGFSQKTFLQLLKELRLLADKRSRKSSAIPFREIELLFWTFIFKKVLLERKKMESMALALEVFKMSPITKTIKKLIKNTTVSVRKFPTLHKLLKALPADAKNIEESKVETGAPELVMQKDEIESPQFFTHAGVVLLHPFLNSLFDKLKLVKKGDFKNFTSRSKAVLLVHFLASGREQLPEYNMVLPKFLCEVPFNMPLDHTLKLAKKEKEAANELLEAAIAHWGVLGNTSPEGLREGFLNREGKLEKVGAGWKLNVEQKAQDILLDKLPWNLSLIKLPWMKEILRVEWR